jgi:hypothetical protein
MSSSGEDAPTPSQLNLEFEDLDSEQQKVLTDVFRFCLRKIAEAKEELSRALVRTSPKVFRHFKINSTESSDKLRIRQIISNYNRIAGVLLGHERVRYDGEETGPYFVGSVIAYVRSLGPLDKGETGEIKIVKPEFMNAPFEQKARTIIHEIAHRFVGIKGDEYYGDSMRIKISKEQAINNADSYANFAIEKPRPASIRSRIQFNLKTPTARAQSRRK